MIYLMPENGWIYTERSMSQVGNRKNSILSFYKLKIFARSQNILNIEFRLRGVI